jgi:nitrogen regulatory protein P-II 1
VFTGCFHEGRYAPEGHEAVGAILRPFKRDEVQDARAEVGVQGMTVTEVNVFSRNGGRKEVCRGSAHLVDFVPTVIREVAAPDKRVSSLIDAIRRSVHEGRIGDRKIFVAPIEEAGSIRTGERNNAI